MGQSGLFTKWFRNLHTGTLLLTLTVIFAVLSKHTVTVQALDYDHRVFPRSDTSDDGTRDHFLRSLRSVPFDEDNDDDDNNMIGKIVPKIEMRSLRSMPNRESAVPPQTNDHQANHYFRSIRDALALKMRRTSMDNERDHYLRTLRGGSSTTKPSTPDGGYTARDHYLRSIRSAATSPLYYYDADQLDKCLLAARVVI